MSADIVLCTVNARWSHASFGLRCLRANLGELRERSVIVEKTLEHRAVDVVESILEHAPKIVGLGVYIWNASLLLDVARILKRVRPDLALVVGGPEVSHESEAQEICSLADVVIAGEGDLAFADVARRVLSPLSLSTLASRQHRSPSLAFAPQKSVSGGSPNLVDVRMPYDLYDEVDVKDRVVYVEASRGCPFTCSFCLSALDDGVRTFPLDAFLAELALLYDRGLRRFKFVDRTFNLRIDDAAKILDFFLERINSFAHFEMIPDRLPDALRSRLARFEPGRVQLEVGIQTLNETTAKLIRRRLDVDKIEDNLRFLADTGVHVHADLIAGLPGEDLASFGAGFDRLFAMRPSEIQVGVLKRLRGSPLADDAKAHPEWGLVFDAAPPYPILCSTALTFADVQRISRFARAMDLVGNSGRFPRSAALLFAQPSPFASFLAFSDWLFRETGARHGIALARLADLIARYLVDVAHVDAAEVSRALESDLGRDRVPRAHALPDRQARRIAQ